VAHFGAVTGVVVSYFSWFDLLARLRVAESMTGARLSCFKILKLLFLQKTRLVSFILHSLPSHFFIFSIVLYMDNAPSVFSVLGHLKEMGRCSLLTP
jgi:hypothetical protein